MTYAFLAHSISGQEVTTWASFFFTPEGNDTKKPERETSIARSVCEDFMFKVECNYDIDHSVGRGGGRPSEEELIVLSMTSTDSRQAAAMLAASEGVFRIPAGPLYSESKVVVWKVVLKCAYVLVCDEHENRLLAAEFLERLVHAMGELYKNPVISAVPREFLLWPEEISALIQSLLPNGQLLFTNAQLSKHLQAEVQIMLEKRNASGNRTRSGASDKTK